MSGRRPPGFLARAPRGVVLALPSRSGSAPRRESQASVVGPARETPPSSPEQYAQGQGQDDDWEQMSGYAAWDYIQADPSQGHAEPHVPPGGAHTTPLYTSATWPSSPRFPNTPPEYPPPPPLPYEEARQWTEAIV